VRLTFYWKLKEKVNMADIITRVPEDQLRHFLDDKMTSALAFWRFGSKPKRLAVGDYIFFTRPEGVVAGAEVIEISQRQLNTVDTQGNWKAIWKGTETRRIEPPISDIQYAQQSYRYATAEESERLREAYDAA
jgi:hypothetical protein